MIAALMLAQAAAAVAGPPAPADSRHQTVFVGWDARGKACVPQVHGVATGDIATRDGKAALVAALPDKGAAIHLIGRGGASIPYDCVADIRAALEHAGFYGGIALTAQPAVR